MRLEQRLLRRWNHEVDDRRRAARRGARGAGEEVVGAHRAHEGKLHVHVRIDPAGHDVRAAGVEDRRARGRREIHPHRRDRLADHEHIGATLLVRGDDGAASNQGCLGHR